MAALPYMQLYIADYLADTMHLSAEEHGAYLLLMFNYWQTGRAIPKSRLAKIARVSSERWGAVEESLREFFIDNGTEWVHERIENDLAAVRDVLAKKSAAGKASVQSRRNRKKTQASSGSNTCSTGVGSVFKQEANKKGTNKDIDLKELNPTHNARAHASAPVSQPGIMEQPVVTEPEYREGLNEPIGKFSMMDDWHPSLDFRQRAAQWGVALPEHQMTEGELKRLAERLLAKWTKHVGNGFSIPPVRRQLAAPRHPAGPTPAQLMMEEFRRRKAAGRL
ncbi:DUF1376 domain-containing protein [Salmonella enterica]|nr:DUF1376 domain-containing protein [Salmonella enterica]